MKQIEVSMKVDNGVPIPVNNRLALPLKDMEVGQSFEFPLPRRTSIASRASVLKKKEGLEFTIRKVDEQTARIWRVK